MKLSIARSSRNAFSLLEIAVVLVIIGLMTGLIMQSGSSLNVSSCYGKTQAQLGSVNAAIEAYVRNNNRYPTPAARNVNASDPLFGREASGASIDTIANGGNPILTGALPFLTLGLSDSFAGDCWGNKLSYYVTESLTRSDPTGFPNAATNGVISVRSGVIDPVAPQLLMDAAYAVISHGEDGVGAVARNYSGGGHGWCGVGTHIDTENCDGASTGNNRVYTAPFNNGAAAGVNYYDDIIVFSGKHFSNCNQSAYTVVWDQDGNVCSGSVAGLRAHGSEAIPVSSVTPPGNAWTRCINGSMVHDATQAFDCGATSCGTDPFGGGGGGTCTLGCPAGHVELEWADGECGTTIDMATPGAEGEERWSQDIVGTQPINSTAPGTTGGAFYVRCQSGQWVPSRQFYCFKTGVGCWQEVTYSWWSPAMGCSGTQPGGWVPANTNVAIPNSAVGRTGTKTMRCVNGTNWSSISANCHNVPCTNTTVTWGSGCTVAGLSPGVEGEVAGPFTNGASGMTGSTMIRCSGGTWVADAPSNCSSAPSCSGGDFGWGAGCKGTFPPLAEGETISPVTNTDPGFTGTAEAVCIGGAMQISGHNCDPVSPSDCPATGLVWGIGCKAMFPHGSDGDDITGNPNIAPGFIGAGDSHCKSGAWQPATGTCNPAGGGGASCPNQLVNWGGACSASLPDSADGAVLGPVPNTAMHHTGTATWQCNAGAWVNVGGTCTPYGLDDCPATTLNWYPGCSAVFPFTMNGATTATVANTDPSHTGHATATCQGGNWITPSGPCNQNPGYQSCGSTGGCGIGGLGYTFYNDVVPVHCPIGKCRYTSPHTQFWACGGAVPPGPQVYQLADCFP